MFTRTIHAIVLAILLIVFVASIFAVVTVHPNEWTNLTDAQQYAQFDRFIQADVNACEQAGGSWYAGFADAGCDVSYTQPDTSWYITPISNPVYETWEWVGPLLITIAIVDFLSLILLPATWIGSCY